ncbi:MAG: DUF3990 domain-containing protein [Mediterranea sp.]|jgi:hypothetical protein|nr:DUF3990 domain-containing protein [Mediterranea sp.]
MQVYHGSYTEITQIDLTKGRSNRDFGRGFYVTRIRSQAELWAKRTGRLHQKDGVVTEFTFYENAFTEWGFNVLRFNAYTEEWLDFVLMNRNPFSTQTHNYDIIEGPVADDDVANRIADYLQGTVSRTTFLQELSYHRPTHQICFCSLKSLQVLVPIGITPSVAIKEIIRPVIETLVKEKGISWANATDILWNSNIFKTIVQKGDGKIEMTWEKVYKLLLSEF